MVNISFTQNNEIFNKYNVPDFTYCHQWFTETLQFPLALEFERTYYKRINGNLVGFRVLGYSIDDTRTPYKLSYLVQLPNQEPKWEKDFISPSINVYASVEDYIMSSGSNVVNLGWASITATQQTKSYHGYTDRFFFKGTFYTIKNGAVCIATDVNCSRLFVTKNGWLVGISRKNYGNNGEQGVYLHKEDAVRVLLNNMGIIDFAEQPISIDITILPNTPKITKLQFVD